MTSAFVHWITQWVTRAVLRLGFSLPVRNSRRERRTCFVEPLGSVRTLPSHCACLLVTGNPRWISCFTRNSPRLRASGCWSCFPPHHAAYATGEIGGVLTAKGCRLRPDYVRVDMRPHSFSWQPRGLAGKQRGHPRSQVAWSAMGQLVLVPA